LDAFPVRLPTLRIEKSLESCHFGGDILVTAVHFVLYNSENLLGIVPIFEEKNMYSPMKKSAATTNQI
jgi:hypothetical protein